MYRAPAKANAGTDLKIGHYIGKRINRLLARKRVRRVETRLIPLLQKAQSP